MCGRYTNTLGRGDLQEHFATNIATDIGSGRYNVAPTEQILTIVRDRDGARAARIVRWGLVPWWSKDLKRAASMINARVETVQTKAAFRDLVASAEGRALIVADGWYEWLKAEDRRQRRQPFRFTVDGGEPFAFAGLWTHATVDGDRIETATILTMSAQENRVAAAIHDRMPVVLGERASQLAWLDEELDGPAAVELCHALPEQRLGVAAANPRVNKSGLDDEGPDLLLAPLGA
jgi:putative SOS response-associated peptidase YedK